MSKESTMTEHTEIPSDITDDNQMYAAEYKDGQLHIVEVSPYDKTAEESQSDLTYESSSVLPELVSNDDEEQTKYLQLDLLNFTIVKNSDGTNTYQMVSTDSAAADSGDATITCVLSSDDVDEGENPESYVMLQTDDEQDPYMLYSAEATTSRTEPPTSESQAAPAQASNKTKSLTPVQILEKAKALQKAKALLSRAGRGRGRRGALPPALELLAAPGFKLYLYSCKQCTFKCNAIKEMSAHKKAEHSGGGKGVARAACLQCARCPFRGHTHAQLMSHVSRSHSKDSTTTANEYITALQLDSEEVEAADVLVCGACGFESGDRALFKKHIEDEHGAITSVQ